MAAVGAGLAGVGAAGCEVRATPQKGFGLFATAPHPAEGLIFEDESLFVMQHTGNRRVVAACANCCAFIGSLHGQVEAIFNEARFAPLLQACGGMVGEWEASLAAASGRPAVAGVRCSQGCRELYCSEACRDAHFRHSHNLLCTGPIESEEHPLIQFKYHSLEHADTLLLAAQAFAHLVNRAKAAGGGAAVTRKYMAELLCFCNAPFRDACRPPPGRPKDMEFYAHLDGLLNRGAGLLRAALEPHAPEEVGALFEAGPDFFSKVMGMFEYNNIDVEVPSPLGPVFVERARALYAAASAGGPLAGQAAEALRLMEQLLREKEWVMRCVWGEETTGIYNPDVEAVANTPDAPMSTSEQAADAGMDDAVVTSTAMDEARRAVDAMSLEQLLQAPWPSMHGIGLFATIARTNHSCEPNVKVRFLNNSSKLSAHALRPLVAGEELCISYINQDDSVMSRKQQLLEYGFNCSCERCLREDSGDQRKATRRLK